MRFSFLLALVVATFAVTCFHDASAKEAVEIKTFTEMWQKTLPKVKSVNAFKNAGKIRGEAKAAAAKASAAARKNWDDVITKLQAGGKLKTLDTSKKEWQTAFTKAEQAGQLQGASKEQVVKVTEDAAQAMAKNPSKWRYVKKALEITFGAVLTALIVVGLNSMFS
ncbi:hypothetical protein PF005_g27995 [Phytophthora fragariae]|uniref:RxLR effector protein n=1 Tax=Phytophthora fragariae TaxID=53985 RepID=A0A6A3QPQ7_9STRA|nr:hypothetical protein PF003_g25770 [Phytophthora fragariae]KAE8921279.1 hypothetical protein PF009_g28437 [Phytophthora fragariae]KAE8969310.1 hypothetical protein PF011_g26851 [Phytophthora fragariae]KAE9067613.1 hypothetical protein PF010_g27395 [Phytophthora fragariae]KAE9067834.1 hypothetical protein PF007_g27923 [Phytophthora fragariae]